MSTLTEAIEETAKTLGISTSAAKMKIIEACHAGHIGARWYGYYRGGSPPITLHEWAGADIIMVEGDAVLVPANGGQRKRGISVNPGDFAAWLTAQTAPAASVRQSARQGGKSARVDRAARAIWGNGGPPAHLESKVICREIVARLKADEGKEPNINEKTIRASVAKIGK